MKTQHSGPTMYVTALIVLFTSNTVLKKTRVCTLLVSNLFFGGLNYVIGLFFLFTTTFK